MDEARANDPMRNTLHALIDIWRESIGPKVSYTAAELVERAGGATLNNGAFDPSWVEHPELHEVLTRVAGLPRGGIEVRKVGNWLKTVLKRVYDGHRIEILKESRSHGNRYTLVRVAAGSS
jgi:hypothetical protein